MRISCFWDLLLIMYKINNPQVNFIPLICKRSMNDKGGITQWYIHRFKIQIETKPSKYIQIRINKYKSIRDYKGRYQLRQAINDLAFKLLLKVDMISTSALQSS